MFFCFVLLIFKKKLQKYILQGSKDNKAINYATELSILKGVAGKCNCTLKGALFCSQKYRWENGNWEFESCMAILTTLSTEKRHYYFCTTSSSLSTETGLLSGTQITMYSFELDNRHESIIGAQFLSAAAASLWALALSPYPSTPKSLPEQLQ